MNKSSLWLFMALCACSLAPKFQEPEVQIPAAFKEDKQEDTSEGISWQQAFPMEADDRGKWWKIYGDPLLNEYAEEAAKSNQSLSAMQARVVESRALASTVKAGFFPTIDIGGNALRAKTSSGALAAFGNNSNTDIKPYTLYSTQATIAYEVDLFGKVHDSYMAANLEKDAQISMYNSMLLALQADVAQHYFSLRTFDSEIKLLQQTIDIRQEASRIMGKKFKEGAASQQDNFRALSELASIQADLLDVTRQRATLEHALAVLLGKNPTDFHFAANPLQQLNPPRVPVGLPSLLLLRRPDINAALNQVKAANARIGVAKAAFFPSLSLSASGGYTSTGLNNLFNWSGHSWAAGQLAGNALSLPIFHGGRNKANLQAATAAYEAAIANYRQQVLTAFRDVEDNLVSQNLLAEQAAKQELAADFSSKTTALSQKRYNEGEADYFEVVDSERISLAAQRQATKLTGQRLLASISLIRALGGDWN